MVLKLSMICTLQSNGSYFAICPEIDNCFTQGDTYEEARENLQDLVEATINEDYSKESLQELALSNAKIFSEFEMAV